MPDQTKLGQFDRTIRNCEVVDIPAGATPKYISVRLPGEDRPVVDAWWDGNPALSAGNFVKLARNVGVPQYEVSGVSGGTAALPSAHTHPAADIVSGVMATARLGSGTASISTFLRGDSTWAAAGGGGGWPFAQVLTVGSAGDYATVAAAIAAAVSGDLIWADVGVHTCDNLTLPSGVGLAGMGRDLTYFTSSANSTTLQAAGGNRVSNCTISNTRNDAATGFPLRVNANTVELFNTRVYGSNAVGGVNTVEVTGSAVLIAREFEFAQDSVNGTAFYHNSSAMDCQLIDGTITGDDNSIDFNAGGGFIRNVKVTGTIPNLGNLIGQYYDSSGNLIFIPGRGESGGVWLHQESTGLRIKYTTLGQALTAAATGDTIKLGTGTYTITLAALSLNKSVTVEGDGPAATIITGAISNSPTVDVTADNMTFRNLTIQHTSTGSVAGPLSTDNTNLVLDNVYLDKTSGASTTSYGLWMYGGSVTLKNGTRISCTAGTTKYGIYNDTADATITIFGGQVGGDTQDIYTARAGSTLNLNGSTTLTNNLFSWAGLIFYNTTDRAKLLAARTYYVRTDGSDSNNGLVNTAGGAFLTIQKAVDVVSGTLDLGNYDVTIDIANGTYAGAIELKNLITGAGAVILDGDIGTPSNVHISLTGNCITGNHITGVYTVQGLKLTASGGGIALLNQAGGLLRYGNIEFAAAGYHLFAQNNSMFYSFANYSITGGANAHIHLQTYGKYFQQAAVTITLSGAPAFASNFIYTGYLSQGWFSAATFSGSATGKRYTVETNGIIYSGGGASFFPGNSAGSTATGGLYL